MNTNENPLVSDDVIKFQASVPFNDIIQEKESKNNAFNRIKYYLTSKYPTSFKSAHFTGSGDETLIVVSFKDADEFNLLLADEHDNLKQSDSSKSLPKFHLYDAAKIRTEESLRSIVVTDIPLFLKFNDVKSRFAQHGTIQKFSTKFHVPKSYYYLHRSQCCQKIGKHMDLLVQMPMFTCRSCHTYQSRS